MKKTCKKKALLSEDYFKMCDLAKYYCLKNSQKKKEKEKNVINFTVYSICLFFCSI